MTMATVASVGIAGTIALFKKGKRAYQQWADSNLEESFANLLTEETTEETTEESVVTEAEVQSAEEFAEYAMTVLKQAFGDDFDEAKAQEVIDGLTSKYGEDYGAMVGALQSSLA
jgi:hypothetical protein